MKYVIITFLAVFLAASDVSAQARPRTSKTSKEKKPTANHPNDNKVPAPVLIRKK